ncbi:hypothetical protein ACFWUZ_34500 [Streptomyces sp. NPDC058646]|uniref:hypothetical protein n=1 Tax=Streptomyces sp. NPDC058646 TaxID=3346574 RepID=UPI00364F1CA2
MAEASSNGASRAGESSNPHLHAAPRRPGYRAFRPGRPTSSPAPKPAATQGRTALLIIIEQTVDAGASLDVPHIGRSEFTLIDIDDRWLSLMAVDGGMKKDVKVPEGELGRDIIAAFQEGREFQVLVLTAMGKEGVVSFRGGSRILCAPLCPRSRCGNFWITVGCWFAVDHRSGQLPGWRPELRRAAGPSS